jgi:hypothetical protein
MRDICIVAIARDEDAFIAEWIAYHRLLGADHFYIYDDDPVERLPQLLEAFAEFVTVVRWYGVSDGIPGRNRQTKAYSHFLDHHAAGYRWVAFIDIDEFIALRETATLSEFLLGFPGCAAISLQWHVFGHCGFYDDPPGLITELLTRRKSTPTRQFKSITQTSAISGITSGHSCELRTGCLQVDANGRPFRGKMYEGISQRAHVNHYQCRSFKRWMARVTRGDVNVNPNGGEAAADRWRVDADVCLRQFVETVALDKNEYRDDFMKRFAAPIRAFLQKEGGASSDRRHAAPVVR